MGVAMRPAAADSSTTSTHTGSTSAATCQGAVPSWATTGLSLTPNAADVDPQFDGAAAKRAAAVFSSQKCAHPHSMKSSRYASVELSPAATSAGVITASEAARTMAMSEGVFIVYASACAPASMRVGLSL